MKEKSVYAFLINLYVDVYCLFLDYIPLRTNDYIVEGIIMVLAHLDALVVTLPICLEQRKCMVCWIEIVPEHVQKPSE